MKHWDVGLRQHEGKWFSASLDNHGVAILEIEDGVETPSEAVNQLREILRAQKEQEDWQAYLWARYRV
ncbi:hypothetical protein [Parerythrobacter jejuensis]|uniref:Uncharacterized protein n=1 Tax=Parerythrobacter jejuensis TaxID=795812 RepID=A0A845AR83_9SPHN|nr:hypothetical protein [Parerythrobacter jejuensis]MXP31703.1 hypothetical protein [Parerythrobacter jejuensis]